MLKSVLLTTLLLSCNPNSTSTTPNPIRACVVPPDPPLPVLKWHACSTSVCLNILDSQALAKWAHDVREIEVALAGCNLVERK